MNKLEFAKMWWQIHQNASPNYVKAPEVVPTTHVFPNLRANELANALTILEVAGDVITLSADPILVSVKNGRLVIEDGHHRFANAILNGHSHVRVREYTPR